MKLNANIETASGRKAIENALAIEQKGCTARTLSDATYISGICGSVAASIGISKAALKGTTIHYTGARHFAKAYQYTPESTHFLAEYNGRTWIVTGIFRAECPNRHNSTTVVLSGTAKEALIEKYSDLYI